KIKATTQKGTTEALTVTNTPYPKASFLTDVEQLDILAAPRSFYMMSQSGFDTHLPQQALSNGLEVTREYQDDSGKNVSSVAQGAELNVVLRVRSTTGKNISDVAIIDLLPGGFEILRDSVRNKYNHWQSEYTDIREDRVIFYGDFGDMMTELTYKVKVTAAGRFVVPPVYAESMYDLSVKAHSQSGHVDVTAAK
ncbi:alpha-2-macroglobulin family protein, partial [Pseudoalteromonas sp. SG41-6]|nr:alpha-2-macroglobulin family protein [Pseudoalteromonas sp. SG41-6]